MVTLVSQQILILVAMLNVLPQILRLREVPVIVNAKTEVM
jgi:hypothetical protein